MSGGLKIPSWWKIFGITILAERCRTVIGGGIFNSHWTTFIDSFSCTPFDKFIHRSSQMHMHFMSPLVPENRKPEVNPYGVMLIFGLFSLLFVLFIALKINITPYGENVYYLTTELKFKIWRVYIFEKFFYHWEIRPSGFPEIMETWSADAFEMTYKLKYSLSYRLYAEIFIFLVKKCSVRLLSTMWTSKSLVENYVKYWRHTVKKDIRASFTWVVLHPCLTTTFPCTGQSCGNSCRGCKISLPRP